MRVAYLSPMPPAKTGIADYSAELLPGLAAEGLEIELFTDPTSVAGSSESVPWSAFPYREFPTRRRDAPWDTVVYQMGNDARAHAAIHDLLLETPGVVVLHEFVLHHMIRERTLVQGDWRGYEREMSYCYGETGRAAARRMLDLDLPVDPWRFPLFERVVDRSLGVLVHNETTRDRVLASRPHAAVGVVPSPVDPTAFETLDGDGDAFRRDLGLPPGTPLVGSFGLVTPLKRLEPSLAAFQRFRRSRPEARYLIVGPVSPWFDLDALLEGEAGRGVTVMGRVDLETLHRAMAAVDVAMNLRYPSAGETSATLMRLMGAGTATIVTDDGPMAELPGDCCVKIRPDGYEEILLAEMLLALFEREELRRAIGENARRFVRENHAVDRTARLYREHLERFAREAEPPRPAVPPLAPMEEGDVTNRWLAEIAGACGDLGVDETDRELLGGVAAVLADLGVDP